MHVEFQRTVLIQDDFNRTDSTDIGAAWDSGYTSNANLQIVGNRLRTTSTTIDSVESYNVTTLPANCWAQMTVSTITGAGLCAPRIDLYMTAPATHTCYEFMAGRNLSGSETVRIARVIAGSRTTLINRTDITWVAGDILRGQILNGQLEMYRNNLLLLSTRDLGTKPTSVRAGINVFSDIIANCEVDDFIGGGFSPRHNMSLWPVLIGWN